MPAGWPILVVHGAHRNDRMSIDTWLGASGDWNLTTDWANGAPPSATDTALIAAPGNYLVTLFGTAAVGGLTMAASGAEFYDAGALALSGTLALQSGTLALAYGAIDGGTLALSGGTFQTTGGTLDGVAVQGTLDLSAANSTLFVRDGMTLSGAGGSGAGSIALTGGYAALDFIGSQTLNNTTVSFGASSSAPGQAGATTLGIIHAAGATAGATLTLGSSFWLRQAGNAGVSGVIAVGSTGVSPGAALPDMLVNQGIITAGVSGATLDISGTGTFVNQGTLAVSNGATLEIATAGFANAGRIVVSGGALALGGTFSASRLSGLGALSLSAGQVEILGTANNIGGTLSLGTGSALGAFGPVGLAGTILGGVALDTGNGLNFASGTGVLDGTAYAGVLNLSAAGAGVTLTDGARATSLGGAAGSIIDTGAGSALLLRGAELLDNATVLLGSAGTASVIGTTDTWLASVGTTATLGAHLSVQQTGLYASLAANGWSAVPGFGVADTLINQGTITGLVAGGRLAISGYGTFVNQGSITLGGGDTLAVSVGQFANAGNITAGAGGTVLLGQPAGAFGAAPVWSNAGQIAVNGGTLVLAGGISTSQLGTITESSGSVQLAGTLSNVGATLTLGTHGGPLSLPALSLSGTILGGTVADSTGVLCAGNTGTALLDGVSYLGTLALTQAGAFLRLRDGLALSGVADVIGAASVLDFQGSQTIDHAQIVLGAIGAAACLDLMHDPAAGGADTLKLGAGLTVNQSGSLATIGRTGGVAGDMIVNAGTINAAVTGGTFTLGGAAFVNQGHINVSNGDMLVVAAGSFTNAGSITVTNAMLSLAGSLSLSGLGQITLSNGVIAEAGLLDLAGGTLQIGQGTPIGRLALTGTLRGGTIVDAGGGLACSGAATLDGITYAGLLDLSRPFSQLTVSHGLTLASNGGRSGMLLTGAEARLIAATSETFDNAAITLGSASQYYAGQHIPAPELDAAPGVQLTLGAGDTLALFGTAGTLGNASFGQWSDSIVNAGQIQAATALGTLSIGSSFFTNTGTIAASATGVVIFGDVGVTNAGLLSVGAGSAVQITLLDYYAAPNAGASVFTNTGTIAMQGGVFQELTANGLFPAVPVVNAAGAAIQGNGLVFAQVANAGTIEARGGTLILAQPVQGSGSVLIDSGATLELGGAEPAGQVVRFASSGGTLKIDQPSSYAGTLSGYTAGDVIDLPNLILTSVGISSGTLVASTATQNFRFLATTPTGGEVSAGHDVHGGAMITFTPQIPGPGAVAAQIGVGQPNMLFWASPAGDVFGGISANMTGSHIGNWSGADSLDLTDMLPGAATLTAVQNPNLETLTITDGVHTSSVSLTGTFAAASFHLTSDQHGGTLLTYGH